MEILISDESCRFCLQNESETISIFESIDNRLISDIMMELTGLKIEECDIFSNMICLNCKSKIVDFLQFKQMCCDSEDTVRINLMIVDESGLKLESEEYIIQEDNDYDEILEDVNNEEDNKNQTLTRIDISKLPVSDQVTEKMREIHFARENLKKHKCPECDKYFMFPSKVQRHYTAVHASKSPKKIIKKNHACNICGKLFSSQFKVRRHMIVHDNEMKIGLQKNWSKGYLLCEACNKKFHAQATFDRHQLICDFIQSSIIKRPRSHKYICVICDEKFSSHDDMAEHLKIHSHEESFTCFLCESSPEYNFVEISKHCRFHDENATYECCVCSKKYPNGDEIVAHLLRHKDYKPFKCSQCQKGFFDKYKLKQHMNTHNPDAPKNFICEYCNKPFGTQEYLTCHIRRKHSTVKPFQCKICAKSFAFSHDLTVHSSLHTGERRYNCDLCESSFAKSFALNKHMQTRHKNEIYDSSRFQCQICSYSTSDKKKWSNHLATHEDDESTRNVELIKDPQLTSYDGLSDDENTNRYDLEIQTAF